MSGWVFFFPPAAGPQRFFPSKVRKHASPWSCRRCKIFCSAFLSPPPPSHTWLFSEWSEGKKGFSSSSPENVTMSHSFFCHPFCTTFLWAAVTTYVRRWLGSYSYMSTERNKKSKPVGASSSVFPPRIFYPLYREEIAPGTNSKLN